MLFDEVELFLGEFAWFLQHAIGDADLADVMQQSAQPDIVDLLLR